jgi:hypothetical protein
MNPCKFLIFLFFFSVLAFHAFCVSIGTPIQEFNELEPVVGILHQAEDVEVAQNETAVKGAE